MLKNLKRMYVNMIRIKNIIKTGPVFLMVILFLMSSLAATSGQHIQQDAFQVEDLSVPIFENLDWDVEYNAKAGFRVATDSDNNVVVVGNGGCGTVLDVPCGVTVKYGPNGDVIWSDHRFVSLFRLIIAHVYLFRWIIFHPGLTVPAKQPSNIWKTISFIQSSLNSKALPVEKSPNKIFSFFSRHHQYFEASSPNIIFLWNYVRFYDVVVDNNDDIVVVGEIQNRKTNDMHHTMYVIKYDSDGHVLWDRIYKRNWLKPEDWGYGVATDSNDNIFIAGIGREKKSDNYKGWILKLSPDNGVIVKESIHPDKSIKYYDVATDSQDNVFVAGYIPPSEETKVVKYSNDLTILDEWKPPYRPFISYAINVDPYDNVIVAGCSGSNRNYRQYAVKFSSDGTILWSNKSTEEGGWSDVVALSHNVTALTGWRNETEILGRFYVGLYDENGKEFKRFLGGTPDKRQMFFSYGLDVDKNGDILVTGVRYYALYYTYMRTMKFYQ